MTHCLQELGFDGPMDRESLQVLLDASAPLMGDGERFKKIVVLAHFSDTNTPYDFHHWGPIRLRRSQPTMSTIKRFAKSISPPKPLELRIERIVSCASRWPALMKKGMEYIHDEWRKDMRAKKSEKAKKDRMAKKTEKDNNKMTKKAKKKASLQ